MLFARDEWEWDDSYWELSWDEKYFVFIPLKGLSNVCLGLMSPINFMRQLDDFYFLRQKINNVISNRLEVGLISIKWRKPSYLLLISACQGGREGGREGGMDRRRQYQIKWKFRAEQPDLWFMEFWGLMYGDGLTGWWAGAIVSGITERSRWFTLYWLAVFVKKLMRQHFVGKLRQAKISSLITNRTTHFPLISGWWLNLYTFGDWKTTNIMQFDIIRMWIELLCVCTVYAHTNIIFNFPP